MEPNLRLVSLKVDDLQRMRAFYENLLGAELHEEEPGRLIEYDFGGVLFGLYNPEADFEDSEDIIRGTNCVPGFKVGKDFENYRERLKDETDVEILYEANTAGHRWLVFADPEGNRIEFYKGSTDE